MGEAPRVEAEVTFLAPEDGGRHRMPEAWGSYMPHLTVGDGEHLGVRFVSGPPALHDVASHYVLELMYWPKVCYEALQPGTTFAVREGNRVVATGSVLAPWK